MQNDLLQKKCVPCEGGIPAMTREETEKYKAQVLGWSSSRISDNNTVVDAASFENSLPDERPTRLVKEFTFKDFKESMVFINKVADLAEREGHHPDIHCFYNKVRLELWTHAIGGLSENDFILAAKINNL